jgi:hypothetical protein
MIIALAGAERNTKSAVVQEECLKPKPSQIKGPAKRFSPRAAALWGNLPEAEKNMVVNNVYCGRCRSAVPMVDVSGFVEGSSLVLQGFCGVCGNKVARVIEELD